MAVIVFNPQEDRLALHASEEAGPRQKGMGVPRGFKQSGVAVFGAVLAAAVMAATVPAGAQVDTLEPSETMVFPLEVQAMPTPLDPNDPTRNTVGALTYAGGVELKSTDANFGGLSGLLVDDDGKAFIAMSDRGIWFAGELRFEGDRLAGVAGVQEAPMLDWRGQPLTFANNDSEGLAFGPKGVMVSFEGFHRIWRYSLRSISAGRSLFEQAATAVGPVKAMEKLPSNGGVEALAELPDGRVLAISEEGRTKSGEAMAWLISDDGAEPLSLPVSDDFKPTDATPLPNGDVLVLERRFSLLKGAAMRLRHIRADTIKAGGSMEAEPLAVIQPPMTVDNMEALAAIPMDGGYRIFIASDDNFNLLQRTLLLSFTWKTQ
jgi:hypothetical protein